MAKTAEVKPDTLPDLDDLLQCPVCYEIPTSHIYQCNEGHHVCGQCKARLDLCPVCRSLFFGTRNYAMEELIANVRKLQAFKLGGKMTVTMGSEGSVDRDTPVAGTSTEERPQEVPEPERHSPPQCSKGLFRCVCCKAQTVRLPLARLLNHLRYYHSPSLIEGKSERGEYAQAWQTVPEPGRLVISVRVSDMGIFFLIIEMSRDVINAWVCMAASPIVVFDFCYSLTLLGNDREAVFFDRMPSVRLCEGSLKKNGRCLSVSGPDGRALTSAVNISWKLSLRRTLSHQIIPQPRTVLRVANRGADGSHGSALNLEPLLQGLQNDVARLSRAFAFLGREADLIQVDAGALREVGFQTDEVVAVAPSAPPEAEAQSSPRAPPDDRPMSRSARRRMRQRLLNALIVLEPVYSSRAPDASGPSEGQPRAEGQRRGTRNKHRHRR